MSAQTVSEQVQSAQLEQLTEEVNTLKEKGSAWDKILKAMPKISGYAQLRYDYMDGDDTQSTFQVRRVRVILDGQIAPKLDYRVQAELAGSFALQDAYFSYKPLEGLKLSVGQMKLPFSIENPDIGPTKLEFIDYPMAMTYLVGSEESFGRDVLKAGGRDIGAKFFGSLANGIVGYDLGVYNGSGINCKDNNKSKDVVGRLSIRPVKGLLLSGSYLYGEFGSDYIKRERWGAGVFYDYGRWMVRSEYIGGNTGKDRSEGLYVAGGYRFCKTWMAVARYDVYAMGKLYSDVNTSTVYTAGINWRPVKNFLFQANYAFKDYYIVNNPRRENHQLMVQASVIF